MYMEDASKSYQIMDKGKGQMETDGIVRRMS